MKFVAMTLSLVGAALAVACADKQATETSFNGQEASAVVESFVSEYYKERVGNLTAFLDKYTDWPDFGPADSVMVASNYSIRKLTHNDMVAEIEVKFRVVGEESLGKLEVSEHEEIQVYNVQKRQNSWRIVEPIHIPCVSVSAELKTLRDLIEFSSVRLQKRDFTPQEPEEYFTKLRSDAENSLSILLRYH